MPGPATPTTEKLPVWTERFLAQLREAPVVTYAARVARINRDTAYEWRKRSPSFAAAWDLALEESVDALEVEAFRRSRISDAVLIFMLKSHMSDRYRETIHINVEDEARRRALERGLPPEIADLAAERARRMYG